MVLTFVVGILGNGGAERVISILTKELINKGYEVNIISIYGDRTDYTIDKSIKTDFINCTQNNRFLRYIERIVKLRNKLNKTAPDVIISFLADVNIFTLISTIFIKVKIIVSERNDPNSDPENKLVRLLRNAVYLMADGFVFQTQDAQNYFTGYIRNKGRVIPNPVLSNLPIEPNSKKKNEIVSVCRLAKQKNIIMAIDAFSQFVTLFPNYIFTIYGDGPQREELENYISLLGLKEKINLPGFNSDVHEKIKYSKMLIISSNYEGISNVMLEALAMGLAVISTDCPIGGARLVIRNNENGILVNVNATQELTTAMISLASSSLLYEKITANAPNIKYQFNPEIICEQWINYIERLTKYE